MTDCNSTTDNPLIDTEGQQILHGGNFQAQSITSAVEKIRLSAQRIGRMLFAQSTEIVNPALNNGLSPNLVADEPSRSFLMKSIDLATAVYMSELSFLANPVGSHVQNAELGNQSINSLALISARYTRMALDVLSQLSAAYLYSLCQALDLRAFQAQHLLTVSSNLSELVSTGLSSFVVEGHNNEEMISLLWSHFVKELNTSTGMDSSQRFRHIFVRLTGVAISCGFLNEDENFLPAIKVWANQGCEVVLALFLQFVRITLANPMLPLSSEKPVIVSTATCDKEEQQHGRWDGGTHEVDDLERMDAGAFSAQKMGTIDALAPMPIRCDCDSLEYRVLFLLTKGLIGSIHGDCWSRKARRRKEQEMKMKKLKLKEEDEEMRGRAVKEQPVR